MHFNEFFFLSYLFYKLTSNFFFIYAYFFILHFYFVTSFSRKLNFITLNIPISIPFISNHKNHNFTPILFYYFQKSQNSNSNSKFKKH